MRGCVYGSCDGCMGLNVCAYYRWGLSRVWCVIGLERSLLS